MGQAKVIFDTATGGKIIRKEGHLYDLHVTVEFNKTLYDNEMVFIQQIEPEIAPALGDHSSLFAFDAAGFHRTQAVLDLLPKYNIVPSMIPEGCTGLVQPLDISIN